MKKIILIFLALFLLSGCTIKRIDNYDYDKIVDEVLSLDIKSTNMVGNGYKYYAPRGVTRTDANTYNDVLTREKTTYYLYVDVVSYYYETEVSYEPNKDSYYSYSFSEDGRKGYLQIDKAKDKFYVQMVYNYAKIEAYAKEKDLKTVVTDMSYVLSSLDFNDSLLKKMYESGDLASKEEVYKLFDNKEKEGNFLKYIEEYDKYDGDENENKNVEKELEIKETTTTTTTTEEAKTTTTTESTEQTTSSTQ